jgi:hypothetical protein
MSGLTGSSGLWVTAANTFDGPNTLTAALIATNEAADDMNSRLLGMAMSFH